MTIADQLSAARDRAERVRTMIRARGIAAYNRAFGWNGAQFDGCILHNAGIDFDQGHGPFCSMIVDRSAFREARRIINYDQFVPSNLYDAYARRIIANAYR